jgi:LysM repeat protein
MAAPLRLTRRGVAVVAVAVAVLAIAVVALAARSARVPERAAAPARVTVGPGDTLWSVATRVAPQTDPRAEVSLLQRLNHLAGSTVQPGQVLRTRPPA